MSVAQGVTIMTLMYYFGVTDDGSRRPKYSRLQFIGCLPPDRPLELLFFSLIKDQLSYLLIGKVTRLKHYIITHPAWLRLTVVLETDKYF